METPPARGTLHTHHGTAQIQLVSRARGKEILVVPERCLERSDLVVCRQLVQKGAVFAKVCEQVSIQATAGEEPNLARIVLRNIASVFQRIGARFKKEPVLGIHAFGLARRDSKELSVEQSHIFHNSASPHIALFICTLGLTLGCGKACYRVLTLQHVLPELSDIWSARKSACHADDGNSVQLGILCGFV
jgi:hypothetical protein